MVKQDTYTHACIHDSGLCQGVALFGACQVQQMRARCNRCLEHARCYGCVPGATDAWSMPGATVGLERARCNGWPASALLHL